MNLNTKDILNKSVGFLSLGCDKNRVDLENVMASIVGAGFNVTDDLSTANIVIVNTCSFIEPARVESVDSILQAANLKSLNLEKLIVTGCLNHMNYSDLETSFPEVDLFLKVGDNSKIVNKIYEIYNLTAPAPLPKHKYTRVISTPKHYAYLKISEGCNNFCSYCTIPFIRGNFVSTPIETLVQEAKELVGQGVKELILVGQDVTKYGLDLYGKYELVKLIKELSEIEDLVFIRLLYCYPELISDELIEEIKTNDKLLKYIDMPIQHINDDILKAMNRRSNTNKILSVINKLKQNVPSMSIRSTFILGFPGETEDNFNQVLEFLKEYKLTNVGFFAYSKEEGTKAYNFDNQIEDSIKQSRVEQAYLVQSNVAEQNNLQFVNKTLNCIVDSIENNVAVCRSYLSAPEVDPVVYVENNNNFEVGNIIKVKIVEVLNYDLKGEFYELTK